MRRVVAGVAAAAFLPLALAGCGGGQGSAGGSAAASTSWDCSPSSTLSQAEWTQHCAGTNNSVSEGSVTDPAKSFVQYPNGLRGEITAVKVGPNDGLHPSDEHPDFDEIVTVTFQVSNTGSAPVALNRDAMGTAQLDLFYGENRYQAQGWVTDEHGVQDLPQQLVPGTKASFDSDFTMPSSALDTLAVRYQPDTDYPGYTFTDVQTLVH